MRGSRSASSRSVVSTSRLSDAMFDNGPQDETHKASPSATLRIEAFEGQVQRNIEEMQPLATAGSRSEALKLGEGLAENSKSSTTCVASPKPVPDTSDTSIVSACSEVILDPPVCVPEDLGPIVLDKTQKCVLVDLPIGFGTARPAHQASKPSQPPFSQLGDIVQLSSEEEDRCSSVSQGTLPVKLESVWDLVAEDPKTASEASKVNPSTSQVTSASYQTHGIAGLADGESEADPEVEIIFIPEGTPQDKFSFYSGLGYDPAELIASEVEDWESLCARFDGVDSSVPEARVVSDRKPSSARHKTYEDLVPSVSCSGKIRPPFRHPHVPRSPYRKNRGRFPSASDFGLPTKHPVALQGYYVLYDHYKIFSLNSSSTFAHLLLILMRKPKQGEPPPILCLKMSC